MTTNSGKVAMTNSRQGGFSLIELMIALVAGLIVSYAVLAFSMASFKSNGEYVQSTRLTQGLRDTLDFATRELRRAGYDENSLSYLAAGTNSPFSPMVITNSGAANSCVIYAYDRAGGTVGKVERANGEIRGLRRVVRTVNGRAVGVVEYAQSVTGVAPDCAFDSTPHYASNPSTCTDTSEWCALTDPTLLNITEFMLTDNWTIVGDVDPFRVGVRNVAVSVKGRLAGDNGTSYLNGVDTTYQRGLVSSIKIRSDCQRASIANCNIAPVETP
jgi:prepilin-type N-terminal cleavage/methylation domain-containing protein